MNQILTQDEVEALLKAVGANDFVPDESDELDGSGASKGLTATGRNSQTGRPSGLALISTQTTRFSYSQEKRFEELRPLLEDLAAQMVSGFRSYLIGSLEKEFDVERIILETLNFNDFAQRYDVYGRPFVFTPFTMQPSDRSGVVIFEPALSIGLVEGLMGGTMDPPPPAVWRGLTPIELRLTERMCRELVRELETGWQLHRDVQLKTGSTTHNSHMVARLRDLGLAIVVGMRISLRRTPIGQAYVVIPYSVMEQLHPSRHAEEPVELEDDGIGWESALSSGLMGLNLSFTVRIGETEMNMADLLELQSGDVISLTSATPGHAVACLEGNPKFEGVPGVFQGRKAIRLH